jgi:hypothetical protein
MKIRMLNQKIFHILMCAAGPCLLLFDPGEKEYECTEVSLTQTSSLVCHVYKDLIFSFIIFLSIFLSNDW